jgi:CelD/BcsL family acetyltransferase involved in cellulose biosynthesis
MLRVGGPRPSGRRGPAPPCSGSAERRPSRRGGRPISATSLTGATRPTTTLLTVDPIDDPRWGDLVRRRHAGLFHSPPWLRALRATYDLDLRADVLVDEAENATAGWVSARIDDPSDPRVVSLPFSDYCDPLVDDLETWRRLTEPHLDGARRVQLRCLFNDVPVGDDRFALTGRAKWHATDVTRDPAVVWDSLHAGARRAIRKARSVGVTVETARDERDLRAFFELHLRVRKHKYHLLAQPYRFFEALWHGFLAPGNGVLQLARLGGEVIGGVLFLGWGDVLYYKFNASDPRYLDARPNDLVVWESMLHAHERGYRSLDFGLSDWDQEGLLRFKRKFATDERTIHLLRHDAFDGVSAREREVRALLERLTGLLVDERVPDEVTEEAGDVLYRYFV